MSSNGRLEKLPVEESVHLLASVPYGRIVFTMRALPAIRPVNHLVEDGDVIIRTDLGATVMSTARNGVVVAYEADRIDAVNHAGWSVIVVGTAELVEDPEAVSCYRQLLRPWVDTPMDRVIRIRSEIITGFRLLADSQDQVPPDHD